MSTLRTLLGALSLLILLRADGWRSGSLEEALAAAGAAGTPLVVWLENPADPGGQLYFRETLEGEAVAAALARWVRLRVSAGSGEGVALLGRYPVREVPALVVLGADGELEDALAGTPAPALLLAELNRIQRGERTLRALRRAVAAAPADLLARHALALKLGELGLEVEAREHLASIRSADPAAKTPAGARVRLADLMQEIMGARQGSQASDGMGGEDLQPMYAFLREVRVHDVQLEGWTWLANAEATFGDAHRALDAVEKARAHVAEGGWCAWSPRVLPLFWGRREELSQSERKLALAIAEAALKEAEAGPADTPEARPRLAAALEAAARFRWLTNRKEEARKAARRALELDPLNADAKATVAWLDGPR